MVNAGTNYTVQEIHVLQVPPQPLLYESLSATRFFTKDIDQSLTGTSLVAQTVNRLPTMQKTQVRSLGREGPLEKEMATHPSTLAWKIPWTEEPGRLQSVGSQRVGLD